MGDRIAIVGAGVGGLTAAIALRRAGADVAVYEQTAEPQELGAGLHLWSNAVRALREIELGDRIEPLALEVELEQIHKASGKRVVEWPVGELGRTVGAPSIALTRPRLFRALLEALGHDAVELGRRLTHFEEDEAGVELRFEDGSTERCDLLVAADGLWSIVRSRIHGESPPRYAGYTSWRALVPEGDEKGPAIVRQYWGRGARFVHFRVGDGMRYCVALANAPGDERDPADGARVFLLERFKSFAAPVPGLIESAATWLRTDITDRKPIDSWGSGRVTLLGDAAHPMTPNTSQGAGMAIEDAAVLARLVEERGASPMTLRAYEQARHERANSQIKLAYTAGRFGRIENPLACRIRDKVVIEFIFGGTAWKQIKQFVAAGF
jgi:2-polyprenyl-6-methoxyphenol hydroxylase-like FAD-dependent oxidoreductase